MYLDFERVLKYYYNFKNFIGINDVRDYFHFTDDHIHDIIDELENRNFISPSPGYPEGTASPYAPKGFGPGKLYQITKRGIDYIEKQGEFKESVSTMYNQTITNSPNSHSQIITGSPNSQQNISSNNNLNDQDRLKLEKLNAKIYEVKKELSQIQQNITQSILQNDKTVMEKNS
jgi:hypothetical protein